MSEEHTQNLSDDRAFKQLVIARFDSLDGRMGNLENRMGNMETGVRDLDARMQRLESESERRAVETKPIWERALAEIAELRNETREGFAKLERKIDKGLEILNHDIFQVRANHKDLEARVEKLEPKSS